MTEFRKIESITSIYLRAQNTRENYDLNNHEARKIMLSKIQTESITIIIDLLKHGCRNITSFFQKLIKQDI